MIKNKKQYEITKSWLVKFKESLKDLESDTLIAGLVRDLHINATKSEIEVLEGQIKEYESSTFKN